MKLLNKFIPVSVFCCLMILMESCSTSILVDEWNDSSFHESPLEKIFVIVIRNNPIQRRIWEDAFVGELTRLGVKATSSYKLFPDALPDTNQILEIIQGRGFDGILVTRILQKETDTHFVDGYVTSESKIRYNPFQNVYSTYFRNIEHPGYIDSVTVYRRAIEVWVIRDKERIIWEATSNTHEGNSLAAVKNDVVDLVVPELSKYAIIKSK
ncbi:MAG: hypothetical protein P4L27_02655 [Ignavibacteriaceae bacterium]|nr:hypothetical protein [Ignavibacteriaceae bacterium]